jgi:hypothetical protein
MRTWNARRTEWSRFEKFQGRRDTLPLAGLGRLLLRWREPMRVSSTRPQQITKDRKYRLYVNLSSYGYSNCGESRIPCR